MLQDCVGQAHDGVLVGDGAAAVVFFVEDAGRGVDGKDGPLGHHRELELDAPFGGHGLFEDALGHGDASLEEGKALRGQHAVGGHLTVGLAGLHRLRDAVDLEFAFEHAALRRQWDIRLDHKQAVGVQRGWLFDRLAA